MLSDFQELGTLIFTKKKTTDTNTLYLIRPPPSITPKLPSKTTGGNHDVKVNQGPGAAPGATPTDLNQSTGLERAELLGKMEGKDIFDLAPLEVLVRGTKANPTIIRSRDPVRYVGCSGKQDTILLIFKARDCL